MIRLSRGRVAGIAAAAAVLGLFVGLPLARWLAARNEEAVEKPLPPVLVGSVVQGSISESLFFPGYLSPENTIGIPAKIAARIESVLVREGQRVREGELLARLDDEVPRLQAEQAKAALDAAVAQRAKAVRGVRPEELENARASLAQAEKEVANAKSNLDRTRRLFESGAVPRSKFEEAENAVRSAEVQVDNARRGVKLMEEGASREDLDMAGANEGAARAQYELALLQRSYAEVRSPVEGVVAKVLAKAGNMVGPGSALVAVVQDGSVLAQISLPEKLYAKVAEAPEGVEVVVRPIAYGGERAFLGRVTSISETVDSASRTFLVEAAVRNPGRQLKPGMYVNAELVVRTWKSALLVPSGAVLRRGAERGVFVLEEESEGRARVRYAPVETGVERDGLTRVLSGLGVGERIVVEGNAFLEDGQEVALAAQAEGGGTEGRAAPEAAEAPATDGAKLP